MPYSASPDISAVFRALADPTRRQVVERLCHGPAAMTTLAAPFDMQLPSFAQHLGVLERAGLVRSEKRGRVRTYALAPTALEAAQHWLSAQRALWEQRLDQLEEFLAHPEPPSNVHD